MKSRGSLNRIPIVLREHAQELRHRPTPAEHQLWQRLRFKQLGVKFRRQHVLGKYIADFYSSEASIIIEVDGDTHGTPEQESLDIERDAYFRSIELLVLRYSNHDVLHNMEGVVENILKAITPLSSPRKRGEME